MLAKKSDKCCNAKRDQNNDSPVNNACGNLAFFIQGACIAKPFPVSSDNKGRDSRITSGEIPWSNETFANVAAFREVFGFSSISHERGVARRCGRSPGSNGSASGFKTQRVLSINSRNCTPVELVSSENVVDYNSSLRDFYARVPKKQPGHVAKPHVDPRFCNRQTKRVDGQSNYSKARKGQAGDSHYSARSGMQSSGIHFLSFTQNFEQEGPCR